MSKNVGVSQAENDVDALIALKNRLAMEIDASDSPQDLTNLSRQFLAVIAELVQMKPSAPSRVDEIAEKYSRKLKAIRSPDAPDKAPARRKTQPG